MQAFTAYVVNRDQHGVLVHGLASRSLSDLGSAGTLIRVQFSSLNYKDALAARGEPGVVKTLPHVPGIDAAGTIVDEEHSAGAVLVTGFGLGTEVWGGYGDYVRVPREWILPIPQGLTAKESMVLGTAGFTAALAVDALLHHDTDPQRGEVLVTGATGGVGSIAVMLLSQLGFRVVAQTRKTEEEPYLLALGAARVEDGNNGAEGTDRPLHKARWQAVIDTVGGATLAHALKGVGYGGAVATCGMVGGTQLHSSVFPFILRGIKLLGIDSVLCPMAVREDIWQRLATVWRPRDFALLHRAINRRELDLAIEALLHGRHTRRALVCVDEATCASVG
ncbi:MAG TPA: YhdH/YhfP family quinone oxidoreductase [Acidiferrobacter sp.]|nr:YhdH/YhfP family quinone oxidoreductase [Acidiferrobacter sp.]